MKTNNKKDLALVVNQVLNEFARRLMISPMQIIRESKERTITDIRQLYCKLRHEMHGLTYLETGREINRSITSIRSGIMRINDLLMMRDRKILTMWDRVSDIPGYFV